MPALKCIPQQAQTFGSCTLIGAGSDADDLPWRRRTYQVSPKQIHKPTHFATMAKRVVQGDQIVKLIVGAGAASPQPPVGPALGSKGVKSIVCDQHSLANGRLRR